MEWRRTIDDYTVVKSVSRIENKNWKKIRSGLKLIYDTTEVIFNLISDRGVKGGRKSVRNVIETVLECTNYMLRKHMSERIGKKRVV
jgi:hypothetical protein